MQEHDQQVKFTAENAAEIEENITNKSEILDAENPDHDNDPPASAEPSTGFDGFIVTVGASAGGLEALERFFDSCPADSGAAFVVIQHLSPDHKSMMHDLLGRHTRMPVKMVSDGLEVEANHVFLIPAGTIMRIHESRFLLSPKSPHLLTLPIDIFLNSLADERGSRCVACILSGTGSDGTRGAAEVNAAGGFLLAQDPRDAKFDGMPSSVIATGLVDAILPADQLAARVMSHIHNLPLPEEQQPQTSEQRRPLSPEDARDGILDLLLNASGINFRDYKPATLNRRIERRMQVRHAGSFDGYLHLLENDRDELATLRRELLIPVTSFFRDSDAFEVLAREVVRPLVRDGSAGKDIRVWVAGCSTGEEAYSIAMLFLEEFERGRRWPNLKIFATDVNQQNIDFAAAGHYPESAAAELTPERIERFFTRAGGRYQVKSELRQCIVFARHNLLADPPFTRMGLVSCRNTLIYFTPEAQKRAIQRMQYAIEPEGFLFLGSSESLSGQARGFATIESRQKIFRRTGIGDAPDFSASGIALRARSEHSRTVARNLPARPSEDGRVIEEAMSLMLNEYVPPSMLVNSEHHVVHLFGKVQPYFRVREGSATLDLGRILPESIVPVASALLYKAGKERERMVSDVNTVKLEDGSSRRVRLDVRPLAPRADEQLLLLSFEEMPADSIGGEPIPVDVDAETQARIEILERELGATRESLQATIEELETSNEELQATNEELMASNEELQSSNEELQSVNEELNTVNAEYQEKVAILNRLNADLDSMAKAVGVATIFVDEELNLTRFSPDAVSIFKLRDSDLGRPLDEIAHVLKYPSLIEDLRLTIGSERMSEKQALAPDGQLYLARLLPYRIASTNHRGAVATFVDISAFRDRQRLQAIIDALPEHIAVLEPDGRIALINAAWKRFARANGDPDMRHSGIGSNYLEACYAANGGNDLSAERARFGIKAVLEGSTPAFSMQYPCHSPLEKRWFAMNVAAVQGFEFAAVVSHINISSWYHDHDGDGNES
ncbi:MAG: CheR family methyltransferase [Wenzhouxiangellaceae bacterium]|nr:CheR family methyltransferase [Wenzhouxiangellaceae bacterium]